MSASEKAKTCLWEALDHSGIVLRDSARCREQRRPATLMSPVSVGAISGLVLGSTTSFLITGRLFHPFQAKTPATWRPESWCQHALALLVYLLAGAGLGWIFTLCGSPATGSTLLKLIAAAWVLIASCLLIHALYVNWHVGVVVGLLIDWAVFVAGVLLACAWFGGAA